jgi:hypothetical protein
MKKTLTLFSMLALTGCATAPAPLAWWFDRLDPCQSKGQANYQYPAFCGAGTANSGAVIRAKDGRILGTVK